MTNGVNQPELGLRADEDVDLWVIINRIRTRWRVVLATVVLSTAGFVSAAVIMTPIYRVTTLLVPADSGSDLGLSAALGGLGGLASFAGINIDSAGSATDEALAVLRSREFSEQFILDNQLIPKFFPRDWDTQAHRWKNRAGKEPTPARAFKFFDSKVREVSQDRRTGLVTLTIDWRDGEEAARWSAQLIDRLNDEMRRRALVISDRQVAYLEKELERTQLIETRGAVVRLLDSQLKRRMMASVSPEFAFRVVDRGMAPDPDDVVRPKRLFMFVAGPVVGLTVGCVLALLLSAYSSASRRTTGSQN